LRALPIDVIRENTQKGAAAMDAKYPSTVYEDIVTEDKEIPSVGNGTIPIRIYKSSKTKGKKAPVCVLYSLFTSS
jgi:hypothetical protein